MAFNTGNPIGSTSPKDLSDNARNLDLLLLGENAFYLDRKGVPRKSWKGMEGEHNSDQVRRESEFDTAQSERANEYAGDKLERDTEFAGDQSFRAVEFQEFLASSGYETPINYEPGLTITRQTQQVRYLGELYRPAYEALPFTTVGAEIDPEKWISNGDNALRQELSGIGGAAMSGWKRLPLHTTIRTVNDYLNSTLPSIFENAYLVTDKPDPEDPSTWDWTAALQQSINDHDVVFMNFAGRIRVGDVMRRRKGNFTLIGLGQELTEIYRFNQANCTDSPIVYVEPIDSDISGITFKDFAVKGDATSNNTDGFGIQINWRSAQQYVVKNVTLDGVKVSKTPSAGIVARECSKLTIVRCTVEDTFRDGIQLTGVDGFDISSSRVARTGDDGIACHSGYLGRRVRGRITNNDVSDVNNAKGISLGGARDVTVACNDVIGSYFNGIDIYLDNNFEDADETPCRLILHGNKVLNSRAPTETTLGGVSCIYIHSDNGTLAPEQPWVEYEARTYGAEHKYEAAHIIMTSNILGTNEDAGKTIGGIKYTPRMQYGIRMRYSVRKVVMSGNHIYNARYPIFAENIPGVDEYIPRELIMVANTLHRFETAVTLSGDLYNAANDVFAHNILDGEDTSGYYTETRAFNLLGARCLNVNNNIIKNVNSANQVSNTRMDAYRNTFVNAVEFGTGRINFDPATNTLTNSDSLTGSRAGYSVTVPANGSIFTYVNVAGAQFGDFAMAAFDQEITGCAVYGFIDAVGIVGVEFKNRTASPVVVPIGIIRGRVTKPAI